MQRKRQSWLLRRDLSRSNKCIIQMEEKNLQQCKIRGRGRLTHCVVVWRLKWYEHDLIFILKTVDILELKLEVMDQSVSLIQLEDDGVLFHLTQCPTCSKTHNQQYCLPGFLDSQTDGSVCLVLPVWPGIARNGRCSWRQHHPLSWHSFPSPTLPKRHGILRTKAWV